MLRPEKGLELSSERAPSSEERVRGNALFRLIRQLCSPNTFVVTGTQRRITKNTHTQAQQASGEDKKVKAAIKKFGKQIYCSTYSIL